jgi:hypothetical protein
MEIKAPGTGPSQGTGGEMMMKYYKNMEVLVDKILGKNNGRSLVYSTRCITGSLFVGAHLNLDESLA